MPVPTHPRVDYSDFSEDPIMSCIITHISRMIKKCITFSHKYHMGLLFSLSEKSLGSWQIHDKIDRRVLHFNLVNKTPRLSYKPPCLCMYLNTKFRRLITKSNPTVEPWIGVCADNLSFLLQVHDTSIVAYTPTSRRK
jgi:hypothetical protein